MTFSTYMIGFVIIIIGLALGAYFLRVPTRWIGVGIIVMVGLGILRGVTSTKQKDPP